MNTFQTQIAKNSVKNDHEHGICLLVDLDLSAMVTMQVQSSDTQLALFLSRQRYGQGKRGFN